jgi:hypothetical protein
MGKAVPAEPVVKVASPHCTAAFLTGVPYLLTHFKLAKSNNCFIYLNRRLCSGFLLHLALSP